MDNENNYNNPINCDHLINAAGIFASDVANTIEGLDKKYVPNTYLAKGNYFSLNKKLPISQLVYQMVLNLGENARSALITHLTLEIDHFTICNILVPMQKKLNTPFGLFWLGDLNVNV